MDFKCTDLYHDQYPIYTWINEYANSPFNFTKSNFNLILSQEGGNEAVWESHLCGARTQTHQYGGVTLPFIIPWNTWQLNLLRVLLIQVWTDYWLNCFTFDIHVQNMAAVKNSNFSDMTSLFKLSHFHRFSQTFPLTGNLFFSNEFQHSNSMFIHFSLLRNLDRKIIRNEKN